MKIEKVVVVGLDGATWKILRPLLDAGKLPYFKKYLSQSIYGELVSPIPPLTAPSWMSFATGVNPGKHGVFSFVNPITNHLYKTLDLEYMPFWKIFDIYGISYKLINFPLRHDYQSDLLDDKKCRSLFSKIRNEAEDSFLLEKLIRLTEKKFTLLHKFIKDHDFVFCLIKETDLAQHLFWGTQKLDIFYQKLDILLDKYIFNLNAIKIIISDHGFHETSDTELAIYPLIRQYLKEKEIGFKEVLRKFKLVNLDEERIKYYQNHGYLATQEGLYIKNRNIVKYLQETNYFDYVEIKEKTYSGKYIKDAPDIVWICKYPINTNPFVNKIFTKRVLFLKGEHLNDRKGIYAIQN